MERMRGKRHFGSEKSALRTSGSLITPLPPRHQTPLLLLSLSLRFSPSFCSPVWGFGVLSQSCVLQLVTPTVNLIPGDSNSNGGLWQRLLLSLFADFTVAYLFCVRCRLLSFTYTCMVEIIMLATVEKKKKVIIRKWDFSRRHLHISI